MIIKGGARGGAGNLAAHLVKETNEKVTILEIKGLAGTSVKECLHELMAATVGTECQLGLYHASISPSPGEADLTAEQKARSVALLAKELGLEGQPYIVVEHEKTGASGIERTHHHAVWSRVDEHGKTISDYNNYPAHERASRAAEIEFFHERVQGVFDRPEGVKRPARAPHHSEFQQADRTTLSPRQAEALLTDLWQQSDTGRSFVEAAAEQGFIVCKGDKAPYLVLDAEGDFVRLTRRLPDKASEIYDRLSEVREELPTLNEARDQLNLERVEFEPPVILDRGTGTDHFADETPRKAGAAVEPPDHFSAGLQVAAGIATRAAEPAIEVAGDIGEGLIGLLVGFDVSAGSAQQTEPQPEKTMSQSPPPAPVTRPSPTDLFSEYARARLTGAEMTEVNRQASERANNKNRDIER